MLLQVDKINTFYGLSQVLFDVSLEIDKGEVVVLLGRNGAGKTTTMISIMGLNPPKTGRVTFKGREITGLVPLQGRPPGPRLCPRGPADLSGPDRGRQPGCGPDERSKKGQPLDPGTDLPDLSRPGKIRPPPRRDLERRRTADADHRPHPDGQPRIDSPRRTLRRSGPPGGADVGGIYRCSERRKG